MKTSKILLVIASVLCSFSIWGETYKAEDVFIDGTKWEYRSYGFNSLGTTTIREVPYSSYNELDGVTSVGGYQCYKLWNHIITPDKEEKTFIAFLRVEDNKVYFTPDDTDINWYLMYDFSLEPGEECIIYKYYNQSGQVWPVPLN